MAVKRKGLFDIFRDALDDLEDMPTTSSGGKQQKKTKSQPRVTPSPTRPRAEQARVERQQTKRDTKRERNRSQRQKKFDHYLEGVDERDVDVDSHNQKAIETFIARHEEEMDRIRERHEIEQQRLDERFSERLKRVKERHGERLKRLVERANEGKRIPAAAGKKREHGKGRGRGRGHGRGRN